jgi:hypothetical protein
LAEGGEEVGGGGLEETLDAEQAVLRGGPHIPGCRRRCERPSERVFETAYEQGHLQHFPGCMPQRPPPAPNAPEFH